MFKRVPGTKDILPNEVSNWQEIERISRNIFSIYNYQEIRPPLIEEAALFNRSLGEFTEIVQKQMFLIRNKEDVYCLRPESTASIARAYIENSLDKTIGFAKFYYIGPMFRLERPQKGRLRQFHHIGCEAIGSDDPKLDAEVILLADNLLKSFRIDNYKIKLNSLGCSKDKKELALKLADLLKKNQHNLCEECKSRLNKNTLRILDCKNEACKAVVNKLGLSDKHLCLECKEHFFSVRESLDSLNLNYEFNPLLVRGLDYYTRTVFEIAHKDLGAQDALGAGGRYDGLMKDLGGPDIGGIGFAFGEERILLVNEKRQEATNKCKAYLITLGDQAKKEGIKLLDTLRKSGICCDTDYQNRSLKAAMRSANDLKAEYVLILGEDELKKKVLTLKNMASGEQEDIKQEDLIKRLAR